MSTAPRQTCLVRPALLLTAAAVLAAPVSSVSQDKGHISQPVTIELKYGSDAEQRTKQELERILASYDLSRYTFTHEVIIDEKAIPHSPPVLTLHTRHLGSDDLLLSAYVHEQLHWYLDAHQAQTEAGEAELRKLYPKVPVGYPERAQDEESTYLHLIDCLISLL